MAEKPHQLRLRHHAGAALARHEVGVAAHRVGLVGDVEGHHHTLAGPVLVPAHGGHHGGDAGREGRMGRIGADLVVLDEIEAGRAERADERGGLLRRQADIRLDDGADQRPLATPVSLRVPATPWRGSREPAPVVAGQRTTRASGRSSSPRSKRLPATVDGQRREIGADIGGGETRCGRARAR